MSSFPVLRFRAFDAAGSIAPGAKLYFYVHGTTTPLDTYSVEALTPGQENANPVVADSSGLFGRIYLKTDQLYKVVLKTSAGVVLSTDDNVAALALADASTALRIAQLSSNPLDNGALGDGGTDDSEAVQDAIDAATGVVDLLGKTYRCDSALNLPSNITLRNGTLDFSQAANPPNEAVLARGTVGAAKLLTGTGTVGAASVALANVSGLAADDMALLLSSADAFASGITAGEIAHVEGIAALTVNFYDPILQTYTLANAPTLARIAPIQNVTLERLKVVMSSVASGSGKAIVCDYTRNVVMRDVRVTGAKLGGIAVTNSMDVLLDNCTVRNDGGNGVGIDIGDASRRVTVRDCTVGKVSTGIRIGKSASNDRVTFGVVVDNARLSDVAFGIDGQPAADLITVRGCRVFAINGVHWGIRMCGRWWTIDGCEIDQGGGGYCVYVSQGRTFAGGTRAAQRLLNSRLTNATTAVFLDRAAAGGANMQHLTIAGCDAGEITGTVINFSGTGVWSVWRISQNLITQASAASLVMPHGGSQGVLSGNHFVGNADTGPVSITGDSSPSDLVISGNVIEAGAAKAISVSSYLRVTCTGNVMARSDDADVCAYFASLTGVVVSGNLFNRGTYGMQFATCTDDLDDGNACLNQATGNVTGTTTTGDII